MKRDKFLTVMAVLDDRAQYVLGALQNKLTDVGLVGSHTTDVPFHVSLGSFPVSEQMRLTKKLRQTASVCKPFTLELSRYADFDKKVLYLQPLYSDEIYGLHKLFDGNFPTECRLFRTSRCFAATKSRSKAPNRYSADWLSLLPLR